MQLLRSRACMLSFVVGVLVGAFVQFNLLVLSPLCTYRSVAAVECCEARALFPA